MFIPSVYSKINTKPDYFFTQTYTRYAIRQSSIIFQAKMSQNIRVSLFIFVCSSALLLFVSASKPQEPLRTCEKDEYSESKLLELLGVQSPIRDCLPAEKQELQELIKDIFNSTDTRQTRRNGTNTFSDTTKLSPFPHSATSEVSDMICSSPGNHELKHMCCPVGQWPDKNGTCRGLF